MERFQSKQSRELFSEVARFISYAMQLPPEEIVQAANDRRDTSAKPTQKPTNDIISELIHETLSPEGELDSSAGQLFLGEALEDTGRIMKIIAKTYPDLNNETILEVMSDLETIDTIALLALRSAEDMLPYISKRLASTGSLASERSYTIDNKEDLDLGFIGCPAAGYTTTDSYAGQVKPLPIFKEFIPWAAEVQLLSDEWQDFRKGLEN